MTYQRTKTAVIVEWNGKLRVEHLPKELDLGEIVGGSIEAVPVYGREHDLSLYINGDGKSACLDGSGQPLVNHLLTRMLTVGAGELGFQGDNLVDGDFIAGNAVLLGYDSYTGGSLDVPLDIQRWAERLERRQRRFLLSVGVAVELRDELDAAIREAKGRSIR